MDIPHFVFLLVEEDFEKNEIRLERRLIRYQQNTFELPNEQFRKMFRLSKNLSFNLIESIQEHANATVRNSAIPFYLKVLATLHCFATGSFQGAVGLSSWNCMSQSVISRAISEVSRLSAEHLMGIWVKFPNTQPLKNSTKLIFYEKWGIRGVIGAIDGTHVDIIAPPRSDVDHPPFVYIDRKGRYSINVMLISDAQQKLLAVNARYPGSVHDAAIIRMSNIRNHLKHAYEEGDKSSHLIGDNGYGVEPSLFTSYLNVQPNSLEERYNRHLCSARNIIERTNGNLKKRFACLSQHRILVYHPSKVAYIIYVCAVCHSMALSENLQLDEDNADDSEDAEEEVEVNVDVEKIKLNEITNLGRQVRNQYARDNYM